MKMEDKIKIISISEWLIPFICGFISYGLFNRYLIEWYHYIFYCVGVVIMIFLVERSFRFVIDLVFEKTGKEN